MDVLVLVSEVLWSWLDQVLEGVFQGPVLGSILWSQSPNWCLLWSPWRHPGHRGDILVTVEIPWSPGRCPGHHKHVLTVEMSWSPRRCPCHRGDVVQSRRTRMVADVFWVRRRVTWSRLRQATFSPFTSRISSPTARRPAYNFSVPPSTMSST